MSGPVYYRCRPGTVRPPSAPIALAMLGLGLGLALGCGGAGETGPPVLHWYVFREPSGAFDDAARRCSRRSDGRYRLEIAALPPDADQQREQLVRRLAAHDPDIDLIGMDVIWTAEFAAAGWILPWDEPRAERVRRGTLAVALDTGTFAGRLFAAPLTTNAQLLWYRSDLVAAAPQTFTELIAVAERLAGAGLPHEIEVQGARYEGLTVWFNTLLASAGGSVLDGPDRVALPDGPTRRALETMRGVARSVAAPADLASLREDDGRLAFESGRAAFMLNYPYVWPSARQNAPQVAARLAFARDPRVDAREPSRVTVGGLNLGVAAFSAHPELAFEAAVCLQGDETQRLAATRGGLLPTREALYDDRDVRAELPFADLLRETLRDAAARPKTPAYYDVSLAIQRTLHPPRDIRPDEDAEALRERVGRALGSGGLL
jgi:multiple sugar transport system substrate-binding protein